jgi:hypothetical protein
MNFHIYPSITTRFTPNNFQTSAADPTRRHLNSVSFEGYWRVLMDDKMSMVHVRVYRLCYYCNHLY